MIINDDVFNVIKTLKDTSISLVFCDPPYNLSSTWQIDPVDGKVKHKKQSDFMNKWEGLSGEQLEILFKELFRITKYGAYVVMYGIDRQQMPFEYYAQLAGFEPQQYLYSYKISSFPKASDVCKLIMNREGDEGVIIGKKTGRASKPVANIKGGKYIGYEGNIDLSDIIFPTNNLAKKYDGYKLGVAPYKQVLETVFVFKKPYQKGMSNIDAIYAYEEGNKKISPAIVNIDAGRVPLEKNSRLEKGGSYVGNRTGANVNSMFNQNNGNIDYNIDISNGRYPSQLFIVDDERLKEEIGYNTSDILDKQSGILISGGIKPHVQKNKDVGYMNCAKVTSHRESSSGGSSRINHKCLYSEEEFDILRYCTKTSTAERNAGCNGFDDSDIAYHRKNFKITDNCFSKYPDGTDRPMTLQKNNHPTLKSLELSKNISLLFKPPSENLKDFTVFNPFSGSGSEYIGLLSNGVLEDNIIACELNKDYYDISLARIEYWKDKKFMFRKEDKKELEKVKKKEVKEKKQDVKKSIF